MVDGVRRVLRPGGLTFVATPNFLTNQYWNVYAEEFEDRDATHVNYESVETLRGHFDRFATCYIYGDTPFREQFHAFDVAGAFDRSLLRLPLVRKVGRHVAWKLLGRSVEYSSYLHALQRPERRPEAGRAQFASAPTPSRRMASPLRRRGRAFPLGLRELPAHSPTRLRPFAP
jgi:hypothetical protein